MPWTFFITNRERVLGGVLLDRKGTVVDASAGVAYYPDRVRLQHPRALRERDPVA
ncbi:hypothetical protein [Singulisphaera sp. PoT]|uniref:hypothetical protein n=1 Tax=Singulisphaera sp. PoT TaxID=3411797 RepID=UPI003BF594A7